MTQSSPTTGLGFHHISITTHKMDESLDFYQNVLGMSIAADLQLGERRLVQLNIGDGALVEVCDPTPETKDAASAPLPLNHFGLSTDDLDGTLARVRAAGLRVTIEPRDLNAGSMHGRLAFIEGPNGESIEFMELH